MSFRSLLNKTAEIQRPQRTTDLGGGSGKNFVNVAIAKVRIRPLNLSDRQTDEEVLSSQAGASVHYVLYCESCVDIQRNDRVVCEGVAYTVEAVTRVSNDHHLEVKLEERQRGN